MSKRIFVLPGIPFGYFPLNHFLRSNHWNLAPNDARSPDGFIKGWITL